MTKALSRQHIRTALAVGVLLLPGSFAWAQAKPEKISDGVVKIGVLTDMSGVYSDNSGQGSAIAAQMAVDDFGGRELGKAVHGVAADHQAKADRGPTEAPETALP